MNQYVAWFKAAHHDDFYTNAEIRAAYKSYVRHFILRRNRYTGIRNRDEPTIMTWELAHLYPDAWGKEEKREWGAQWIRDHIRVARRIGKPFVLEEFGLEDKSDDKATRNAVYRHWTDTVLENDGDGDQFWILTGIQDDGTLYPGYDGHRVVYPSSVATLLAEHARDLRRRDRRRVR